MFRYSDGPLDQDLQLRFPDLRAENDDFEAKNSSFLLFTQGSYFRPLRLSSKAQEYSQGWCTYSSTVYRRTKVLICIKSKTLHIIEGLCVLSLKQLIHARRRPSTVVASPAKLNTSLNPHSEVGTEQNVRRAIFRAYVAFRIQLSSIANGVYFATKFLEIGTSR